MPRCGHSLRSAATAYDAPFRHPVDGYFGRIGGSHALSFARTIRLVATYRPDFQPPWVGGSQVTVIALNRLGRNEGAMLVHRLAGNLGALPPDIVDEIVERTDGVPLFVEELTKTMVEAGAVRGYASISAVPLSSLPVPATLHASLLGRLDRLGYEGQGCLRRGPATATS
jgi:predicted ATPase